MIGSRKPLDGAGMAAMLVLCIVLGLHQVALKAAAPFIAPILQIALRSGLSALLIAVVMLLRREQFFLKDGTLAPGLFLGVVFSVEFFFVAEGLKLTSAAHMSVFLYTAPIFTALTLHRFLPAERLQRHQWIGIVLAFSGIVVAFAGGFFTTGLNLRILRGDLLGVLAWASWAATTVIVRATKLAEAPATKTLIYQLLTAFVLLLVVAIVSGQARPVMVPLAWGSVLFQATVITFAAYLAWFSLLRRYNASQLSAFMFLSPLFGVSFGVLLLHETINVTFGLGTVLVLLGITLVGRARPPFRRRETA
jgi:drug/metabolite transporter (DMT)-like permease